MLDNNPLVLSKLDNQKIGDIFFSNISDIINFLSLPSDLRGQNIVFSLKKVLENNNDEISRLLTHEIGKPISQCEREIKRSITILDESVKFELSSNVENSIIILGSMATPIYELAESISKYIHVFSKLIFKPSTKTAITLNFIYQKMCEDLGVAQRVMIAPMTKHTMDEIFSKMPFEKVVKYSRGNIESSSHKLNIEDLSKKDQVLIMDNSSDLDFAINSLVDNMFDFEKINTARLQHVFISKDNIDVFATKLISKCELVLKAGPADNPDVNFSDTFKAYKRKNLKELLLELVSLGADVLYGSIEDAMTSPIIIKCDEKMEDYYQKDFWAPVIFLIEYESEKDIPMLTVPFAHTHKIISLLNKENLEKLKKSSTVEVEDFQNNV